jgi:thiol-disulfide isomerase/thioredoxin
MIDITFNPINQNTAKRLLILITVSLALFSCKRTNNEAEFARNEFEIFISTEGKTDSITMYPHIVSEKLLDSSYSMLFKGSIEDGKVNIRGKKPPHPVMFDIGTKNLGFSDIFFIANGFTELFVSFVDYNNKVIISDETKSETQKEYELLKKTGLDSINDLRSEAGSDKERIRISKVRDTIIVDFIRYNPNSYVPLWLLLNHFSLGNQTYNKLYDQSMPLFSDEIKKTELHKIFKAALDEAKQFSFENKVFALKNIDLEDVQFKLSSLKNSKYILLDFWFSSCGPCLYEMPKYIPIYKKYKDLGFEIVSVSIDNTNKIGDWKAVINEKGFNWIHYLDENGVETNKLNITSFPTTFLVNGSGEILERDINSEKLNNFLSAQFD